jgi:hypothetical protein
MAVTQALRRLLRIRSLQEEQGKLALESALGDLNRLESALTASSERDRRGRELVQQSAQTGELPIRVTGIEETRTALRFAHAIKPHIDAKKQEVNTLRKEYLDKRVERRQTESLLVSIAAQETKEEERRSQQKLDDWYAARHHSPESE